MNRRERRAKAARDRRGGFRLGVIADGVFDGGVPETVRFSTAVRKLRQAGDPDSIANADKLVEEQAKFGNRCPNCGPIADPVLGFIKSGEDRATAAFGCPNCSGPEIKAKWEQEGRVA